MHSRTAVTLGPAFLGLHLLLLLTYFSGGWADLHGYEIAITGRSSLSSKVVGSVVYPQNVKVLSTVPVTVTLFGKWVFVEVIKM